jgi:Fe2+ or Zn2+ uptake regulation protein
MTDVQAKQTLSHAGMRITKDRCAILRFLAQKRAWTASELHARLPNVNLSTIYRNLTAFTNKELLHEAFVHGKEIYYELSNREHHAHTICDSCGTAKCIPCPLNKINRDHSLTVFATCNQCRKRN